MSTPETDATYGVAPKPEFLDAALAYHLPIPLGIADIGEEIAHAQTVAEPSQPGYSLDQAPSWIAEILKTYSQIGELPILGLDICSSVPRHAVRLRLHEYSRDGARARELERSLRSDTALAALNRQAPHLKAVADAAANLKTAEAATLSALLSSAIQQVIYTITPAEATLDKNKPSQALKQRLTDQICSQRTVTVEYQDAHEKRFEEEATEHHKTYLEAVADLEIPSPVARFAEILNGLPSNDPALDKETSLHDTVKVGEELARQFVAWQTHRLAQTIAGNVRFRPARFFSMDSADPRDIAASSIINSPDEARSSVVFTHAIKSLGDSHQHIQGNMFEDLPFPDNSLAIITCFDAYPFHFQKDPGLHPPGTDFGEVAVTTLLNWYQKLAYGGKIVIFPWTVQTDSKKEADHAGRVMKAAAIEVGRIVGHSVPVELLHRETLEGYMMSPTDMVTSKGDLSILAAPNDYFEILVINKPLERSVNNRKKRVALQIKSVGFLGS